MTPPMTDPSPLPASRDTVAAAPPTVVASRARIGSRGRPGSVVSIAADAIRGDLPGGANQPPDPRAGAATVRAPGCAGRAPANRPRPAAYPAGFAYHAEG